MGLDDFVEMTKRYAQGIAPSPFMAAAADDDDDDDDVVVKNPDDLPLHQKVGNLFVVNFLSNQPLVYLFSCFQVKLISDM